MIYFMKSSGSIQKGVRMSGGRAGVVLLPLLLAIACSPIDEAKPATPWPVLEGAVGQDACTPGSSLARCRPRRCLELVEYEAFNQFDLVSRCQETMYFVLPLELLWEDDKGPFDRGVESNLMGGHLWARRNGARIALTTQDSFLLGVQKEVEREEPERLIFEVEPGERLRVHIPTSSVAARLDGCGGVQYPTLMHDCSNEGVGDEGAIHLDISPTDTFAFSLVLPLPFGTREEAKRATFEECGRYCAHPDAVPCATKPDFLYLEDVVVLSGERFMTRCPNFREGHNVIW